jgi:hypothetical protein
MENQENDPFVIRDYFLYDPLYEIYSRKREDTDFFNTYMDYRQYLKYLSIIWQRIKKESKDIGVGQAEQLRIDPEKFPKEWSSLTIKEQSNLDVLQCDFESFIIFSGRFMDKVAKVVEHLIERPEGMKLGESFTEHKKILANNSKLHPSYSEFLDKETYWYEQDLQLLRNKIVIHSGTLTSGVSVSIRKGIAFRKTYGISPLRGKDKEDFLRIKRVYEGRYSDFHVAENDYEMIDYFISGIRKCKIRLDKNDRITIGKIVSRSGASVDLDFLESIARNIEYFLDTCSSIFKAVF